ncbi:ABC transporter ATP-binding protein [Pseudofrankia asymbiotica]|uniref:Dipeptide/oligopeptide/nickel ABC transporter ATP-binding protein n=1 Tax=Pseudofrankia asymbiotica TaxID=1834516 RepID=A0A1V2I9F7_9ACTN|nr:ATP-binding cassette domain-containing protein [Pseudofrankia asymbiotica]ONH27787.1 dipeptide/oligopeptide/nickel ABC transporter ATP-binding protein [Pseudofrankia asymbiotica]
MILDVRGVSRSFRAIGRPPVVALDDVYLRVPEGDTLGLVGESGSGKSTLLRCVMRLEKPDEGEVLFRGRDALPLRGKGLRAYRRQVQMVFQDPASSLSPRMTVEQLVGEGMLVHRLERSAARRRERVAELLDAVGIPPDAMARHPVSFSGGQLQRIAIARALAVEPSLLVCDEPVSALDVSVQAQVLNLLLRTQARTGLSILFVSHDLAVVKYLCPSIAVLEKGRIVEEASRDKLFQAPRAAYTRALIDAVPNPDPVRPGPGSRPPKPRPGGNDAEGNHE